MARDLGFSESRYLEWSGRLLRQLVALQVPGALARRALGGQASDFLDHDCVGIDDCADCRWCTLQHNCIWRAFCWALQKQRFSRVSWFI